MFLSKCQYIIDTESRSHSIFFILSSRTLAALIVIRYSRLNRIRTEKLFFISLHGSIDGFHFSWVVLSLEILSSTSLKELYVNISFSIKGLTEDISNPSPILFVALNHLSIPSVQTKSALLSTSAAVIFLKLKTVSIKAHISECASSVNRISNFIYLLFKRAGLWQFSELFWGHLYSHLTQCILKYFFLYGSFSYISHTK